MKPGGCLYQKSWYRYVGSIFIGLSTKVDKIICPLTLKKQKHCGEKALKVLFCHFGAVKWWSATRSRLAAVERHTLPVYLSVAFNEV